METNSEYVAGDPEPPILFENLPFKELARVVEPAIDGHHSVRLGTVLHPDGSKLLAVEISEVHASRGYAGTRRFSVAHMVHVLMNVGEDEQWQIGNRERDYSGADTAHGSPIEQPMPEKLPHVRRCAGCEAPLTLQSWQINGHQYVCRTCYESMTSQSL